MIMMAKCNMCRDTGSMSLSQMDHVFVKSQQKESDLVKIVRKSLGEHDTQILRAAISTTRNEGTWIYAAIRRKGEEFGEDYYCRVRGD